MVLEMELNGFLLAYFQFKGGIIVRVWIEDKIGFLTGYTTEPMEGYKCVYIDPSQSLEMLGGMLDFHNYYYDGEKVYRDTNNDFQKFLEEEAAKPPEPSKEEMAERLAKLEALLADLL